MQNVNSYYAIIKRNLRNKNYVSQIKCAHSILSVFFNDMHQIMWIKIMQSSYCYFYFILTVFSFKQDRYELKFNSFTIVKTQKYEFSISNKIFNLYVLENKRIPIKTMLENTLRKSLRFSNPYEAFFTIIVLSF